MLGKEWAPCDGPGKANDTKKAKVSKRLQKRVEVVIANRRAKAA
jgi:hypothetical protein